MQRRPTKQISDILKRAFRRGKTNAEALVILKKAHPHTTYSLATVNWYRVKLRGEGLAIPTERECRSGR